MMEGGNATNIVLAEARKLNIPIRGPHWKHWMLSDIQTYQILIHNLTKRLNFYYGIGNIKNPLDHVSMELEPCL